MPVDMGQLNDPSFNLIFTKTTTICETMEAIHYGQNVQTKVSKSSMRSSNPCWGIGIVQSRMPPVLEFSPYLVKLCITRSPLH